MSSPNLEGWPWEGQVTEDTVAFNAPFEGNSDSDFSTASSSTDSSDSSPTYHPASVPSALRPSRPETPVDTFVPFDPDLDCFDFSSSGSLFDTYPTLDYVQCILDGASRKLEVIAKQQEREEQQKREEPVEAARGAQSAIAASRDNMATAEAPSSRPQLVFVDGTFAELAQELADYMQIGDDVKASLDKDQREDALGKIVRASIFLHSAPEKDIVGAYNLLIHLVINESKDPKKYLQTLCTNLHKPFTSSAFNSANIALTEFQAVFNLIPPGNPLRYHVLGEILKFAKAQSMWELMKPSLKSLPQWLENWEVDEEDQRKMFMNIAEFAMDANDDEQGYKYILESLRTFDATDDEEIKSEEAQTLSVRAVRMSLQSNSRFDFQDLRALPTVQALADSQPVYSQLLDIFAEQDLEDYYDFREEHEGWVEKEKLDHDKLTLKMRLLTLTSLAANTYSRQLEYDRIAKALQIPRDDVEKWIIDVIRVKLIEGRMNQRTQVFQIHRTTFRVFGDNQWRELQTRCDAMKDSLKKVLVVLDQAQADAAAQRQRDQQEIERKMQNLNNGDGAQGGGPRRDRRGQHQPQQRQRNDDDD